MKAKLTVRKELQAVITILIYRWENRVPFPIIPSLPSENKHQYKTKPLTDIFFLSRLQVFHKSYLAYFQVLLCNSILGINSNKHKWKAGSYSTMCTKGG